MANNQVLIRTLCALYDSQKEMTAKEVSIMSGLTKIQSYSAFYILMRRGLVKVRHINKWHGDGGESAFFSISKTDKAQARARYLVTKFKGGDNESNSNET